MEYHLQKEAYNQLTIHNAQCTIKEQIPVGFEKYI